jgi:pilus assembly protein Flp/PilA
MLAAIRRFLRDDSGATAIEYALIATLVSVTIVAGALLLGDQLRNLFDNGAAEVIAAQADRVP